MHSQAIVSIVDDDPAYLDSLALLVNSMGLPTLHYSSGDDFLAQFNPETPGCVILDLRLPGASGEVILERLASAPVPPQVIILSGYADVPVVVLAMRRGVVAFLQKHVVSESELWEAVQLAIARDAEQRAAESHKRQARDAFGRLTEPEKQVIDLVLLGKDHSTIAEALRVSRRTVENRRGKAMEKLGVDTMYRLVKLAIDGDSFPSE